MKSIIITFGLVFFTGLATLPVLAQNVEGLVAYWAFDEKEGNIASDSSGNGHNGKLIGDPQWTDDGYLGGALEFDQSADEVNVPYHKDLNPESFTVCAWVNLDSDGTGYRTIVSTRYEFPQKGYILYAGPPLGGNGDFWQFWIGNGVFWDIVKGPTFKTEKWEHLAGVYADGIQKLYLNGILVGEISGMLQPNLSEELLIGAGANERDSHRYFFKGKIDEVQLYNRPLNADEIATVMGSEPSSVERSERMVKVIYFVPKNRPFQWNIPPELDTQMKKVQALYADQMEAHGYGRKTFNLETDTNGKVVVHPVTGEFNDIYYHADTFNKIDNETKTRFNSKTDIYVFVVDVITEQIQGNCGVARFEGGPVMVPATGNCVQGDQGLNLIAHEIGHALNLEHDFRDESYIMSYGATPEKQLSACAASMLNVSPFFNNIGNTGNTPATIQMLTPSTYPPNKENWTLRFNVSDPDGVYQVQFLLSVPGEPTSLSSCQNFKETQNTTVEFNMPTSTTNAPVNTVYIRVVDQNGYLTGISWTLTADESTVIEVDDYNYTDVNNDGVVNIIDLVLVAVRYGEKIVGNPFPNPDVNRDGIVDINDIILVTQDMPPVAGAPSLVATQRSILTSTDWQEVYAALPDKVVDKGIAVLDLLFGNTLPTKTLLLENYPNPFNPETWIPYQLAKSVNVVITIRAINGQIVRKLDVGHQEAGRYVNRSRAAYWDGRNAFGEPVASGLYFCTLTAGKFVATRRMLIRK